MHLLHLANAENTTEGLLLNAMVPPEVDRNDPVGARKIEALATALQTRDHDFNLRVLVEQLDGFGPPLERNIACKVEEFPILLVAYAAENLGHEAELREDDDLVFRGLVDPSQDLTLDCHAFGGREEWIFLPLRIVET
jgi:hypothetical protein